jgi:hypothetical protein
MLNAALAAGGIALKRVFFMLTGLLLILGVSGCMPLPF